MSVDVTDIARASPALSAEPKYAIDIRSVVDMAHRCGVYEALLFELGAELEQPWPDPVRLRATWQRHMRQPLNVRQS